MSKQIHSVIENVSKIHDESCQMLTRLGNVEERSANTHQNSLSHSEAAELDDAALNTIILMENFTMLELLPNHVVMVVLLSSWYSVSNTRLCN